MGGIRETVVGFLVVMAIMIWVFDIEPNQVFGFAIAIMAIAVVGNVLRVWFEHGGKASKKEVAKRMEEMQADLKELKKRVGEMQEYVTDLYIQQDDRKLR